MRALDKLYPAPRTCAGHAWNSRIVRREGLQGLLRLLCLPHLLRPTTPYYAYTAYFRYRPTDPHNPCNTYNIYYLSGTRIATHSTRLLLLLLLHTRSHLQADGLPHGRGVMIYERGIYDGDWFKVRAPAAFILRPDLSQTYARACARAHTCACARTQTH
jgi:hypothetical protein